MNTLKNNPRNFEDIRVNVRLKLSALWITVMFCYIYGDIIGFYQPGFINSVKAGKMGSLGDVTQGLLLGVAVFMSIPAIMVFLSLLLKPAPNRLLNIIFGILYTLIMLITIITGPWAYYLYLGIVEIMFTLLIVYYAWKWPKEAEIAG